MVATVNGIVASLEAADRAASEASRELEVQVAEVSCELRHTLLRILRPVLAELNYLRATVRALQEKVDASDSLGTRLDALSEEIRQQKGHLFAVNEQLQEWSDQRRTFERNISGECGEIRVLTRDLEARLEEAQKDLRTVSREAARSKKEEERLQEQHDRSVKDANDSAAQLARNFRRQQDEIMEHVKELQLKREELMEELYGEDKGLTRIEKDIIILKQSVQPVPEQKRRLDALTNHLTDLDSRHTSLKDEFFKSEVVFADFSVEVREKFDAQRQDLNLEMNKFLAHHASMMQSTRQEITIEFEAHKLHRQSFVEFQQKIQKVCDDLAERLASEGRRSDVLHRDIVREIEENQKRRKKDRLGIEEEIQKARRELASAQSEGLQTREKLECLSKLLALLLEGERMSSALIIQDFTDRRAERWLATPSERDRKPATPLPAEALEKQRPPRLPAGGQLIQVDWRAGLASSAYLPGQVSFGSACYERRDLLLLHHKLLQRAHQAYFQGPLSEGGTAPTTASSGAWPTFGGCGARRQGSFGGIGSLPWEDSEDLKPHSVGTHYQRPCSRQRPGSQGQPEGTGSRLGMYGAVGDTTPPPIRHAAGSPVVPQVRLPAIGGCSDGIPIPEGMPKSLTAR